MQRLAGRLRLPPLAQDALLALVVTVMQVQGVGSSAAASEVASRSLDDLGHLAYVLLVTSGVVLVARRRWPVTVLGVTALSSLVYFGLEFPDGPAWIALFVSLYTLTAHGDGRRSLMIAGVAIAVLTTGWLLAAADIEPRAALGWVFFRIGGSIMSAALGESARSRRVIADEAEDRAERAERTLEDEARSRVDAERLRIAREVHDTVAHCIAIINIQAGVTAHVLDKRPEQAREALVAIEQTSSRALQEMRAVLGVLRTSSDDTREPHPGLGELDDLAVKAREAGLDLQIDAPQPATPVPSALGSAVYRILQESITNVIRHVGPTRVHVALAYKPDAIELCVTDDGRRPAAGHDHPARHDPDARLRGNGADGSPAVGRGIVGMRERCQLLGGDLVAGERPEGGFQVEARLPLTPTGVVHP